MWRVVISALALASCYRPNEVLCEVVTCGQDDSCPAGLACTGGQCLAPNEPACGSTEPLTDAASGCVLTKYAGQVCPPMGDVMPSVEVSGDLDTTLCAAPFTEMGTVCLVFANKVTLHNVRATGERTLMAIGRDGISIDGVVDVGSYVPSKTGAGGNVGCIAPGSPGAGGSQGPGNGGGGGAGGSYQGSGGDGGVGEKTNQPASGGTGGTFSDEALRGGCQGGSGGGADGAGGGGNNGNGGGAVYLVTPESIVFDGASAKILAGGSGGGGGGIPAGGGGGGGSGGTIILEAAKLQAESGSPTLCANGGGGGAGGGAPNGGSAENGNNGFDACPNGMISRVSGGTSAQDGDQGDGGNGSVGASVQGAAAVAGDDGGGGGGGAAGYIVFVGSHAGTVLGSLVSPSPSLRTK